MSEAEKSKSCATNTEKNVSLDNLFCAADRLHLNSSVKSLTREQLLDRFISSRPKEPLLSEEEIMAEVNAVRYTK